MGRSDWSRSSAYDAIFTALGGEYGMSRLGYWATPPLSSRQVNMADNCYVKYLFIRKKSLQVRTLETLRIVGNDYKVLCTKKSLKKWFSRHKEIAQFRSSCSQDKLCQIEWLKFIFLRTRATTRFKTIPTSVHKSPTIKHRYQMSVVFS